MSTPATDPQTVLRAADRQGRRCPSLRGRRPVARGCLRRACRRARCRGEDAGRPGGHGHERMSQHPGRGEAGVRGPSADAELPLRHAAAPGRRLAIAFAARSSSSRIDQSDATEQVTVHIGATGLASDPSATLTTLLNARPRPIRARRRPMPSPTSLSLPSPISPPLDRQWAPATYAAVLEIGRSSEATSTSPSTRNDNATGGRPARPGGHDRHRDRDRLARLGVAPADQAGCSPRPSSASPGPTRLGPSRPQARPTCGPGHARVRDDDPDLHDDRALRQLGRDERGRGEVVAGDGGHPQRRDAVPAARPARCSASGRWPSRSTSRPVAGRLSRSSLQGRSAPLVLGEGRGVALPEGLTIRAPAALRRVWRVGFLLYSVLYAAAGSLVSRQEDVNSGDADDPHRDPATSSGSTRARACSTSGPAGSPSCPRSRSSARS